MPPSSPKATATRELHTEPVNEKRTYRKSGYYAKDLKGEDEHAMFEELWDGFEKDFPGMTENIANRMMLRRCIVSLIQLERPEPDPLGTNGDRRVLDYKHARLKLVLAMYDALGLNRKQAMKVEEKSDLASQLVRMGASGGKAPRKKYGADDLVRP